MISFVLTGPESSGKSVLARELAKHFGGFLVKEYAREYVEHLKTSYTFEDVEIIARQQIADYKKAKNRNGKHVLVFFDTFLIITKVWFEEVFSCCPAWIHQAIKSCKTDYALLCSPDLPWEPDGVRENPRIRQYLFQRYLRELEYYRVPYGVIEGKGEKRVENAVEIIENHLQFVTR